MNKKMFAVCLTMLEGLAACGGNDHGGGDFIVGGTNTPGSGTSYAFVPPVVNSSRVYTDTIVDNSNNTISVGDRQTVTAVASDGSITEQQQSTTGPGDTVDGTNYTALTETEMFNAFGRETSYTYLESNGDPGSCTYDPYAGGATPPLTVGQTWQINYTQVCNANPPIDYTQQGSVVDVESVTVPGGTFTALKLQSTTSWTTPNGTSHLQTTTHWLDPATFHSVKQSITTMDSGTAPTNGYAISRQGVLESTS